MGSKDIDDETREIIVSFIGEGYERLDDAESQLVRLGSGQSNTESLNCIFRLFHSVKGSAGYLGFESIKRLTHEAETLLDFYLKSGKAISPSSVDIIYDTIDILRKMIRKVETEMSDESEAETAEAGCASLRKHMEEIKNSPSPVSQAAASAGPEKGKQEMQAEVPAFEDARNEIVLSFLVSKDMVERFLGESMDLIEEVERRAIRVSEDGGSNSVEAINDMFRAAHTIKGNSGFFGYGLLEKKCQELESLLDQVRKGTSSANEAFVNSVLSRIDGLRQSITSVKILEEGSAAEPAASAQEVPPPLAETPEPPPASKEEEAPSPESLVDAYKPIGEILVDLGAAREDDVRMALEKQEKPIGELLVESGAAKKEDVERALEIQKAASGTEKGGTEDVQRREIRVDTAKLDKLFELVGELITAEAMVGNSPDLAGLKLERFQKAFSALGKISREIQETAMMIRMIPLEGLFHKMTRLVRDLSRKFDRPIELSVSGQDTEMDKNVIEQISDPLVHILRNAIDHGIESQERRVAAGKHKVGRISLDAHYEGSEIWVTISDDGAGLRRDKILAKAIEKGMIKGDTDAIPDEEVWKLIFEPGFSTADKVSEVSGRGVGMDVVKKNLERIRGRVDIKTRPGKGTDFILKIPLTMAIIDGITVRSGRNFYSIPLGDILEFFKVSQEQLNGTAEGEETVNLRGSILPLIKLGEIFGNEGSILDPLHGTVIVLHSAGRKACLLIDEVVGNQQIVIKSLSEYLGHIEGVSGCSILGDGTVSFILDTARPLSRRLE